MEYDYKKVDDSGYEQLAVGFYGGCETCLSAHGFETDEEGQEAYEAGEIADDPSFSWQDCELCGGLPGDRYTAHGLIDGEWYHLEVCGDCVQYIANGELPPDDGE